jgi:hypothetical protein
MDGAHYQWWGAVSHNPSIHPMGHNRVCILAIDFAQNLSQNIFNTSKLSEPL